MVVETIYQNGLLAAAAYADWGVGDNPDLALIGNNRGQTTIYVVNKSRTNSKYLKRLVSAPGAVKQANPLKEKVKESGINRKYCNDLKTGI